jgi:hypothetical protein
VTSSPRARIAKLAKDIEALRARQIAVLERDTSLDRFASYYGRELDFCRDHFLDDQRRQKQFWAAPRSMFTKLMEHRRVTVRSCRKGSKTETLADLILAFTQTGPSLVVSTAAGGRQVETGLWSRVNAQFLRSTVPLLGECMTTKLTVAPEWSAVGFSTNDATRFQGFHAGVEPPQDPALLDVPDDGTPDEVIIEAIERAAHEVSKKSNVKRLLLAFDEAAGIAQIIFDAAKGSMLGDYTYVIMGANPTLEYEAEHEFCSSHRPGSGYWRIRITGPEAANEEPDPVEADETFVVPRWLARIADFERNYPSSSPLFLPHARGRFMSGSTEGRVIPYAMLRDAAEPCESNLQRGAHVGVDTAREGGDANVASLFVDSVKVSVSSWHSMDTVETWAHLKRLRLHWSAAISREIPWANVHIDDAPVASGVVDTAKHEGCYLDRVAFGASPTCAWNSALGLGDVVFANRRAEMYWVLRELLRTRKACIPDKYKESWRQLAAHNYTFRKGTNVVVIEAKEEVKRRLGRSPDDADSDVLAFAKAPTLTVRRVG